MFNNIRGILNRRSDQNRSPESLLSRSSDDSTENNVDSAEGFLCPTCFEAFPTGDALQNHYESAHSENLNDASHDRNTHVCPACKMKLGSEIELQSHFSRHHSGEKNEGDAKAMELQIKAFEEIKLYLENELKTKSQEITKLKEERDGYEQMAAKQTSELADLKLHVDELNSTKVYLQSALKASEEKVSKLKVEIQQRPEEDDVIELKKGIKSVQEKMNELALQKEAEKDSLQKQFNFLQETCSKLQVEKAQLESFIRNCPKKEEMDSLHKKISEMSLSITNLKEELSKKEAEKQKLQLSLEKLENYDEIKASLTKKQNSVEELLRQSQEKDSIVTKLKDELNKLKIEMEEMKTEKERLFSEISKGKGATEAMVQLKDENARLQQQFINQQTLLLKAADENESKLNELRSCLKKTQTELLVANEKCNELESELNEIQSRFSESSAEKDTVIKELNLQIAKLSASQGVDQARIQNLEKELYDIKTLYDDKSSTFEKSLKELELEKKSCADVVEKLQTAKKNQEKYISELAEKLTHVENDTVNKEKKLFELENAHKELNSIHEEEKKQKLQLEEECTTWKNNYEESCEKFKCLQAVIEENEAAKVDFCDKISCLNEELLNSQLKESELTSEIENLNSVNSQIKEKCVFLEDEVQNLKSSVTRLQNEKNSLLNEMEKVQKSVTELNELKTSHEKAIKDLTEFNHKEKAHSEKVMKDFNLAKEVYLNDKLKMQKQIENLENDCAKQLSEIQQTVKSLENQLEEAEEKSAILNSSLEDTKELLRKKEVEWEETKARHVAQMGILTENIQTLREDLASEQKRKENLEEELNEIKGIKLELDAKLENALEERSGLLERYIKSEAECEKLQKSVTEMRHKYEDCVAALQELGRENQTLQVENMKHITRKWADDGEVTHCTACGKLFTVTVRKHHCRNCGNIFCNECSAKTATVASSKKPVRVCDVCYTEVTK